MVSEKVTGPVKLKFDAKEVTAKGGQTILDAAREAGVRIPTLCHNDALTPYGACRLCSVEIINKRGRKRIVASCLYPVEDGLTVLPNSERVVKSRKMIIELLLSRCPDAKVLQDLAKEYSIEKVRFKPKKENCILCGMCVRVCTERLGAGAIGFLGRGNIRRVGIPFEDENSDNCVGCGACTYVCPTGAIQMEAKTLERFRNIRDGKSKECRYMMMGVVDYKICPNDYKCATCEVDQRMEDTFGTHPALVVKKTADSEPVKIKEFTLEPELLYFKGHLWLNRIDGRVRVGLDDFARRLLGNIDDLWLPPLDSGIKRGGTLLEINIGKKNARMLSPISGRIVDINPDVKDNPDIVSKDPYRLGWIFTIKPENEDEVKELLRGYEARKWLKSDVDRLYQWVDKELGVTLTDGSGNLVANIPEALKDDEWNRLTKEFFLRI